MILTREQCDKLHKQRTWHKAEEDSLFETIDALRFACEAWISWDKMTSVAFPSLVDMDASYDRAIELTKAAGVEEGTG
mgnify:CR=1 FL=1